MSPVAEYVGNIKRSATSILEGMAVTFSYLLRPPITTQYPDRTPKPITDLIPERYRGFLWVDLDICISCRLCERACPIDCIKIDDEKIDKILVTSALDGKPTPKIKDPTRFDINLYKCMYCALCVEPCPTGAIHFTKEFEGATPNLSDLHLRLVSAERKAHVLAAAAEAAAKEAAKKAAKEAAKPKPAPAPKAEAPAAAAGAAQPAAKEAAATAVQDAAPPAGDGGGGGDGGDGGGAPAPKPEAAPPDGNGAP